MLDLFHYSSQPFVLDRTRTYTQRHFKPCGLWLSVGDDWKQWCEKEEFHLAGLTHRTPIVLRSDANLRVISDLFQFDTFTAKYQNQWAPFDPIDWPRVVEDYDGIIIAPYFWDRRMTHWYYSWDCASACIWNIKCLFNE